MPDSQESTESSVERHQRLVASLPTHPSVERDLFVALFERLPDELAVTPYLHAVEWNGGRFDLLLTDGHDAWCAVEVKASTRIYGTGRQRKNRRTKRGKKWNLLIDQAREALTHLASHKPAATHRAFAILLENNEPSVVWPQQRSRGSVRPS